MHNPTKLHQNPFRMFWVMQLTQSDWFETTCIVASLRRNGSHQRPPDLTDSIDQTGGAANDGHEHAGHVSGVWICLLGIDFDLAVLPSNRLLLRFQGCSRSKSELETIRLYSDDHCVFHTWICLSIIILQLQEVYTTYFAAVTCILPLFWKELHTAL